MSACLSMLLIPYKTVHKNQATVWSEVLRSTQNLAGHPSVHTRDSIRVRGHRWTSSACWPSGVNILVLESATEDTQTPCPLSASISASLSSLLAWWYSHPVYWVLSGCEQRESDLFYFQVCSLTRTVKGWREKPAKHKQKTGDVQFLPVPSAIKTC